MCMAASIVATAQINPSEYIDLELEHDYTLEYMKSFKGKYTPTEGGQLIEYGAVPVYLADGTEIDTQYAGYIGGKQAYQFAVTPGTTYFFRQDFVMIGGTFSIAMNPEVKLLSVTPQLEERYDPAANSYIELVFNQALSIDRCELAVGAELKADVDIITGGSTISIDLNPQLQKWYNQDLIAGGEQLTVTLCGVTDGIGTQLDNITYSYKAAKKPNTFVEAKLPSAVSSWYKESSDESRASFTFTGDMASDPTVQLCYAPVEIGYEYIEPLPAIVSGNTITVDFSGKHRTSANMSAEGRTDKSIYVRMLSLKDSDGQMIWSTGQGTIGSFVFELPFAEIPRLDITSEFTPSAGSNLAGRESVKIYFNCADHIAYFGVTFTSGDESVTVPADRITVDNISASEVELTVNIPDGWSAKSDVTITLDGLATDDGYDHSADIKGKFNGFVVTYCSIKEGDAIKSLLKGQIIKTDTNLADGDALSCTITNGEGTVTYGPEAMTQSSAGTFIHELAHDLYFDLGQSYCLTLTTADGKTETINFAGANVPYEFSAVHFTAIDPADGSELMAGQAVNITFDGLALIEPLDDSAPFSATAVDATDGYSATWQLTLGQSGDQTVLFKATDMDNITVEGNSGMGISSYFSFTFHQSESSIEAIIPANAEGAVYDLCGRRVNHTGKGLYIINGKKTAVK